MGLSWARPVTCKDGWLCGELDTLVKGNKWLPDIQAGLGSWDTEIKACSLLFILSLRLEIYLPFSSFLSSCVVLLQWNLKVRESFSCFLTFWIYFLIKFNLAKQILNKFKLLTWPISWKMSDLSNATTGKDSARVRARGARGIARFATMKKTSVLLHHVNGHTKVRHQHRSSR